MTEGESVRAREGEGMVKLTCQGDPGPHQRALNNILAPGRRTGRCPGWWDGAAIKGYVSAPLSRRQNSTGSCVGLENALISADPFEHRLHTSPVAPAVNKTNVRVCARGFPGSGLPCSGF